ncbi:MAG: autotransporter assembly complex protein TamA [Pseudooceanicola atlanticus]
MPFSFRAALHGPTLAGILALSLGLTPTWAAEVVVRVPGAEDLADGVRGASLSQTAVDEGRTAPQDLIAAARADYRRVLAALYEQGYFDAEVNIRVDGREAANLSALNAPAQVGQIEIAVNPGPRFAFGRAEVTPLPQGVRPIEGFATGAPAGTAIMRDAANGGVEAWRNVGHAKAEVASQDIVADHAANTVSARFSIAPGPRLTFGRARVSPDSADSAVRPDRIRAIAGVPEGRTYSPEDISRAERRLRRTGAFRAANIAEDEAIGPGNTLGTEISVEDAKPRRFGAGAEISTVEGLRLSGFWLHRNAFGGAERLRFDAEVAGIGGQTGGIDYSLGATLTRPAFRHPDAQLSYGVLLEREDEPTYLSDRFHIFAGVERILDDKTTVTGEIGFRAARTKDPFGTRNFRHVLLNAGGVWDNRDSTTNPTTGAYVEIDLMPFIGVSGSASGVRATTDVRGYLPLGDSVVLAGRTQLGSLMGASIASTPPDFLFFSGGGGTVRGQGYQSLGVGTGPGRTGGRSFAALSAELRTDITDKIGAVAFVDYGYVAVSSTFDGGQWHGGAGLGIRYQTGLGPIRADIAMPVTGGGNSVNLYVGIGQSF